MDALAATPDMFAGRLADPANEDALLVAQARRGDNGAFSTLVRRHERRVFRLAGRFFRRREEVEEVAQETFLKAWTKLSTYRGDAPFEHWLTRLTIRCAYDQLRRQKPDSDSWAAAPGDDLRAPSHDPNAALEVERLLATLAPADRLVLILLEAEGWSVAEIAEQVGWSKVNVKVRAHRARAKLRRFLEEPPR
jgi:RNA polymerase sigma-70 factor (ECF subfamily)